MSITSIAGLFLVFMLAYLYTHRRTVGRERLHECCLVMAVGLLVELLAAGFFSVTYQPEPYWTLTTPVERLAFFYSLLSLLSIGFSFMWLDLLRQFLRLRKIN